VTSSRFVERIRSSTLDPSVRSASIEGESTIGRHGHLLSRRPPLRHGLLPIVTFHHFTTPSWAAADGGWVNPLIVERFTRFAERAAARLDDGIDVRSCFSWSLLDNCEWTLGYRPRFGLVSVDRENCGRTPRPSPRWLGAIARSNRLG